MRAIDIVLTMLGAGAALTAIKLYQKYDDGSLGDEADAPYPVLVLTAAERAAHKAARPIIVEAGKKAMGRALTPAELQYVGAVAWLETNYGNGWSRSHPEMVGANNWGAVSCKPGSPDCIAGQTDRFSDGTEYTTGFRKYASPVDGAADVVKHVLKQRPRTAAALAASKPSAMRTSYAMRRERYYGGVCSKAAGKYGASDAAASFQDPDKNEGTRACAEETITSHANIALRNARAIAESVGEPLALRLGTYKDADTWYRGTTA